MSSGASGSISTSQSLVWASPESDWKTTRRSTTRPKQILGAYPKFSSAPRVRMADPNRLLKQVSMASKGGSIKKGAPKCSLLVLPVCEMLPGEQTSEQTSATKEPVASAQLQSRPSGHAIVVASSVCTHSEQVLIRSVTRRFLADAGVADPAAKPHPKEPRTPR